MIWLLRPRKKYLIKPLIISLLIVGIYEGVSLKFNTFNKTRLITDDLFTRLKYKIKPIPKETKDIAIISIDNRAYDYFGKKWPWGREIFAELVYRLSTYQPKVIGLNLAFIGASQNPTVDDLLAHSFEVAGNVISASYFDSEGGYHAPYEKLAIACKGFGFTNKPADPDNTIRRTKLFVKTVHNIILDYSFELKTACSFLDIPFGNIDFNGKEVVVDKKWEILINKDGTIPLDYSAKLEDFQLIPILDILQSKIPPDSIKNKIVIMCMTGEAFRDIQKTPLGPLPGAVIIANNILMFLRNNYIKEIPNFFTTLLLLILAVFLGCTIYKSNIIKGAIYLLSSILIFYLVSIIMIVFNIRWDFFSIPFVLVFIYIANNSYKNIGSLIENITIKRKVIRDPLTGLATKNYFRIRLQKDLDRVNKKGGYLSLVMFSIDNYKNLLSSLGTDGVNNILKRVSIIIKRNSRKTRYADFISHYNEDKFCVILRNTPPEKAKLYTGRIKNLINKKTNIALKIGVSTYPLTKTESAELFIQNAENLLG